MSDLEAKIIKLETIVERQQEELRAIPVLQHSVATMEANQTRIMDDISSMRRTLISIHTAIGTLNNTAASGKTLVKVLLALGGIMATVIAAGAWIFEHIKEAFQ